MNTQVVATSKFLNLILRHQPEKIGLSLDANGWADIAELLRLSAAKGKPLTRALLEEVVVTNDKQRFVLSEDGTKSGLTKGTRFPWIWVWCPSCHRRCCFTALPPASWSPFVNKGYSKAAVSMCISPRMRPPR